MAQRRRAAKSAAIRARAGERAARLCLGAVTLLLLGAAAVASLRHDEPGTFRGRTAREWHAALSDSAAERRAEAAFALGVLRPAEIAIVRSLVGQLGDANAGVRTEAALALRAIGREPGGARMVRAMGMAAVEHSAAADLTIGALHIVAGVRDTLSPGDLRTLARCLHASDRRVRVAAIWTLGHAPGPVHQAVDALRTGLADEAPEVRELALEALVRLDPDRARVRRDAAAAMMDTAAAVRAAASRAISNLPASGTARAAGAPPTP
jgi:hypothetical protein